MNIAYSYRNPAGFTPKAASSFFQCGAGNLVSKGDGKKDKIIIQVNPHQKTNFKEEKQWKESKSFSGIMKRIKRFFSDEEGAALVEYGLLVGLIAAVCVAVVTTLGTTISTKINAIVAA
ncbi:MAG: Flp family type IVb pilin, partial [Syntrophobacteraceae bacterium]